MNTEKINLEIEGKEFECEVEFDFTKGESAITTGHPDDSQPGTPDVFEIESLTILIEYPHITDKHDIDFLIEDLAEVIIEKLEVIRNED